MTSVTGMKESCDSRPKIESIRFSWGNSNCMKS